MRVFVAGASGAIGSRLVPQLIDAGHDVVGTHNSPASAELLRTLGAKPVMLDLLDAGAVRTAVLEAEPEAIVHQATALANAKWGRNFEKVFARTNELAMTYLEKVVTEFGGIVLRYGLFYGAANDGLIEPVRKRQYPIIGDGGGITSWIHLEDAAAATVLALERDGPATYNIVDDEPAPVRDWLPALAQALGAKPPRRFPVWLARLLAGEAAVVMGTKARGASNAKARRELGWTLRYPTWRTGFKAVYSAIAVANGPKPRPAARTSRSPS